MPGFKPIDLKVKAEILDQIRNQGVSVSEAAASHNRTLFAKRLRLGRTGYYTRPARLASRDQKAVAELRAVHELHPFYGVDRLALHLGWNKKKARRIRTLAGVVVPFPLRSVVMAGLSNQR